MVLGLVLQFAVAACLPCSCLLESGSAFADERFVLSQVATPHDISSGCQQCRNKESVSVRRASRMAVCVKASAPSQHPFCLEFAKTTSQQAVCQDADLAESPNIHELQTLRE
jgi:hypothetical protein